MTMSDWHWLYHHDFACLIPQHSPHTIKVRNGHTHIIRNNGVVYAGLGHMVPSMELFISKNINIDTCELNRSSVFAQKYCRTFQHNWWTWDLHSHTTKVYMKNREAERLNQEQHGEVKFNRCICVIHLRSNNLYDTCMIWLTTFGKQIELTSRQACWRHERIRQWWICDEPKELFVQATDSSWHLRYC